MKTPQRIRTALFASRSFKSKTLLATGQTKILGKFCSIVGGSGKFLTMDRMNPATETTISFEIRPLD